MQSKTKHFQAAHISFWSMKNQKLELLNKPSSVPYNNNNNNNNNGFAFELDNKVPEKTLSKPKRLP